MAEITVLIKEDFDLTIDYKLFDSVYTIPQNIYNNEIIKWSVCGFELNTSSDKRNLDIYVIKNPISVYIRDVKREKLDTLSREFLIANSIEELIKLKRALIETESQKIFDKFEDSIINFT